MPGTTSLKWPMFAPSVGLIGAPVDGLVKGVWQALQGQVSPTKLFTTSIPILQRKNIGGDSQVDFLFGVNGNW